MIRFRWFWVAFLSISLFGCVSTKEYNARLADIDGLKQNVSSLESRLRKTEDERSALKGDLAKLQGEYEDLKKKTKAAEDDNASLNELLKAKKDELSVKVSELRTKLTEKEAEIASLKDQLAATNQEKSALMQEKENVVKEKEKSIAEMQKTYNSLMGEMNEEIKKGEVTITQLKDKLSVNLVEKILFDSGSAEIKRDGKKVLDRVAEILAKVNDKQIRVSGHTDNVPIGPRIRERFASNWELSTARATNVARYLQERGIDPALLSAGGYSEYRPVAPNDTEEGRSRNRRIEIDLVPKDAERMAQAGPASSK